MNEARERLRKVIARYTADPYEREHLEDVVMREFRRSEANGGKRCSKCRQWLPMSAFHENKRRQDGLHNECSDCRRS